MNFADMYALSGPARVGLLGCSSACCLLLVSTVALVTILVRRNRNSPDPSGRSWFSLRDRDS